MYVRRDLPNFVPPHALLDITVLLEQVVRLLLLSALKDIFVLVEPLSLNCVPLVCIAPSVHHPLPKWPVS